MWLPVRSAELIAVVEPANGPKIKELFTMRILLVEDDESIADAVAVLTKQHYVVDIAADGQVGWEFAAACDYDLIMLDVMLPKLDGISLCRQLSRRLSDAHSPAYGTGYRN